MYIVPRPQSWAGTETALWYLSLSLTLNNKLKVKYLLFVLGL